MTHFITKHLIEAGYEEFSVSQDGNSFTSSLDIDLTPYIEKGLLDELRVERNIKLAETDWVVTMHKELGTNIPAAMKTYRAALRDITDSATSLDDVTWPEKP